MTHPTSVSFLLFHAHARARLAGLGTCVSCFTVVSFHICKVSIEDHWSLTSASRTCLAANGGKTNPVEREAVSGCRDRVGYIVLVLDVVCDVIVEGPEAETDVDPTATAATADDGR